MHIIGIVGSPRKGMNTDVLVQAILDGCKRRGAHVEKIYLNDLDIKPCQACRPQDGKGCRLHDDMDVLYQAFRETDGLIIGTPVYYTSVSSQIKLMIDRSYCSAKPIALPSGRTGYQSLIPKHKQGMLVCVSGGSGPEHVWACFEDFWANEINLEITRRIFVSPADKTAESILFPEPKNRPKLLGELFLCGKTFYEEIEKTKNRGNLAQKID